MMAVACGLRAELMSALMKASFQRSLLSATLYRADTQPSSEEKTSRFALKNIVSSAQPFLVERSVTVFLPTGMAE